MKFKVSTRNMLGDGEGTFSLALDILWSEWDFQIDIAFIFWQIEFVWWKEQ